MVYEDLLRGVCVRPSWMRGLRGSGMGEAYGNQAISPRCTFDLFGTFGWAQARGSVSLAILVILNTYACAYNPAVRHACSISHRVFRCGTPANKKGHGPTAEPPDS